MSHPTHDRAADAERRAAEAEAALAEARVSAALEREAARVGFEYPDLAPRLVDRRRVVYDPTTGAVEGAGQAVRELVAGRPGLLVPRGRPGGGTPPGPGVSRPPGPAPQPEVYGLLTPEDDLRRSGGYF